MKFSPTVSSSRRKSRKVCAPAAIVLWECCQQSLDVALTT